MFKIGDFSKLSTISVRMLRYYDEQDMLKPSYIDKDSKYRFYEVDQLETANLIRKLRALGFSNKNIKEILNDPSEDNLNHHFKLRIIEVQTELDDIMKVSKEMSQLAKLDIKRMTHNVVKKTIPSRSVMSLRKTVSTYMDEYLLWDELYDEIRKQTLKVIDDSYTMAIFHDLEYKEENVDIEVQVTVDGNYSSESSAVQYFETEALEVASITFNGSYDKVPEVTQSALQWIELNHYTLMQPTFNIYHRSPAQDDKPENWITECCFIITERKA